jgi:guanylate kinase
VQSTPRSLRPADLLGFRGRLKVTMPKVFVITGPSGVGKGTLISSLLERVPDLELSISATTREPRKGEVDGRDYHFLTLEQFDQRVAAEDFLEFATYSGNRYGTLRSEVRRRLEQGHSVVLEIEVQGARQVRAAMRESVQVFIAPPDPASLRRRLESRGTDSLEAIDARLEVAEQELAAQDEFAHRVVNDELDRAADELERIVRAELGIPLDSPANDQTSR